MKFRFGVFTLFFFIAIQISAQTNQGFTLWGLVKSDSGYVFSGAIVRVLGSDTRGEICNKQGWFSILLEPKEEVTLVITDFNALTPGVFSYTAGEKGGVDTVNFELMYGANELGKIDIIEEGRKSDPTFVDIDLENIKLIPNAGGGVEGIIKTLPGVNSNNELSSQYSVRGGNYDENLVYINGIEIYRPFLIRSGQQEGLSIINSQMVKSLSFSAGGFDASYGDKLSSVLDITYKRPRERGAVFEGSFLGGSGTIYGRSKNRLYSYIVSGRYRSNQYLLNSLDVQGAYRPVFADIQSYLSYRNVTHEIGLLTYYGSNRYQTSPVSQKTKFGTVRDAFQLDVYYDGQEITKYNVLLNALTWNYTPNDKVFINFATSIYQANESEEYDVLAQYFLSQLDNRIGSEGFGDPQYTLGVGSYLNHARNFLQATIFNAQHRGKYSTEKHNIKWGARYQHDFIKDQLKEWRYLDSAGYSVPRSGNDVLELAELTNTQINLETNRFQAHVLDNWVLNKENNAKLNLGVRANYWDYNHQLLLAPRINFGFEPNRAYNVDQLKKHGDSAVFKRHFKVKAAAGFYQQPPFYRELRTRDGKLLEGIKAQQSVHAVAGAEWNFELWKRDKPFKLNVEAYYKYQWDLIPYEIENVRIRYLPEYTATGNVVGVDMQVNGEFIPQLPSWFSLSVMSAREDIEGYFYTDTAGVVRERGSIPKPTDQRYAVNILFQDFLKENEQYRVHLNLVYAHGLPFGPPGYPEYRSALRIPPYRRVDIGFSRVMYNREKSTSPSKLLKLTRSINVSAEVFNAFGIRNTISYLWIKDVYNRGYAVPNYLTSRRINLRLRINL